MGSSANTFKLFHADDDLFLRICNLSVFSKLLALSNSSSSESRMTFETINCLRFVY